MKNKLLVLVSVLDKLGVVVGTTAVKNSPGMSSISPIAEESTRLPLFITFASPAEAAEHIVSELNAYVSTVPELRIWINSHFPDMAFAEEYSVVVEVHRFNVGTGIEGSVRTLRVVNTEGGIKLVEGNKLNLVPDANNKVAGFDLTVPQRVGLTYLNTQINEASGYVEHNFAKPDGTPVQIFCTREGNPVNLF